MVRICIAGLLSVALVGCAEIHTPYKACDAHLDPAGRLRHVVAVSLRERPSEPGYYLISGHYVLFMSQADTIEAARAAAAGAESGPNARFLQALEKRPVDGQSIDLMSLTFDDWREWDRPGFVAAALLEKGAASVVNLWGGEGADVVPPALKSISVVTLTGGGKWREFCAQNGDAVLTTTDEIAN
jgi:hypothetical protein